MAYTATGESPSSSGQAPAHVAIIMDGNGRWAKSRGLPRAAGHKKGAEALRSILQSCGDLGIKFLTVYAFSSENWNRPAPEVSDLMELLKYYLKNELKLLDKNNIKLRIIGDPFKLSEDIRSQVAAAEERTKNNTALTLCIGLSYGSRKEMVRAIRKIAGDIAAGKLLPEELSETRMGDYLDTCGLPDPDLLIRTGGEKRLSNFLLWQSAYAELYFTDTLWPDFTSEHLKEAVADYGQRERRYGSIGQ